MAWEIQKPGIVNRAETLEREVSFYAVCSTAAGTAEKAVSVDPFFRLETGAKVTVRFANTNTASTPTLNVNGTGACQIRYRDTSGYSGYLREYVAAGRTYDLVFDGSCWQIVGDVDTNLDISDSTSSSSSSTAASSAAVKSLADLISALTSRVSSLEDELASGVPMMPTSSTVSALSITVTNRNGTSWSATGPILYGQSYGANLANYSAEAHFSTPSGGTWLWYLSAALQRNGNSNNYLDSGEQFCGVSSGGKEVASKNGIGESDEYDVNMVILTNICWRIS